MRINHDPTNPIIPPWLANRDAVAPCPCGEPVDLSEPFHLVEDLETELKVVYHLGCMEKFLGLDEDYG